MLVEEVWMISGMLMVLVFAFCYFWMSPYRRVSFMRRIRNRNYGIIRFRTHGRNEFPVIVDFDNDILRRFDGIWILDKMKVIRQVGDERRIHAEIDAKKASFSQGCPVITFDWGDMIPLGYEHDEELPAVSRNPQQIESTLRKERSAMEAEVMELKSKEFKRFGNFLMISMILGIIAVGLTAYTMMQVNQMGPLVVDVADKVGRLLTATGV